MRILLSIYLTGAMLVALRFGWHMRYRLDKYDWRYSDVWSSFRFSVVLWPLYLLAPGGLIHPTFTVPVWYEGRAEKEREQDRLAQNLPPCSTMVRYMPRHDESGECSSEFLFSAADLEAMLASRLPEISAEQHGRYPAILNWLRQRDDAMPGPVEVPEPWSGHFLAIAVGMAKRGLGTVKCGECGEVVRCDELATDRWGTGRLGTCAWSYAVWVCPRGHKLLTKESFHFYFGHRGPTNRSGRIPQ